VSGRRDYNSLRLLGIFDLRLFHASGSGSDESLASKWLQETCAIGGIVCYQLFVAAGVLLVYVYALEVYPTYCRNTGAALNLASGRIGSIICGLVFEFMDTGNPLQFFQLCMILAVVNAILIFFLPYETLGKKLTETETPIDDDTLARMPSEVESGAGPAYSASGAANAIDEKKPLKLPGSLTSANQPGYGSVSSPQRPTLPG